MGLVVFEVKLCWVMRPVHLLYSQACWAGNGLRLGCDWSRDQYFHCIFIIVGLVMLCIGCALLGTLNEYCRDIMRHGMGYEWHERCVTYHCYKTATLVH